MTFLRRCSAAISSYRVVDDKRKTISTINTNSWKWSIRYCIYCICFSLLPQVIVQESKDLKEIIARLNERLDEPFVTAGTVTGDKGIKTCASRMQTSSLDLLRRRQVYPTRRRTSTSASWIINHRNLRENECLAKIFATFVDNYQVHLCISTIS